MPFFEGKQLIYNILCLFIIPFGLSFVFYRFFSKKTWLLPVMSIGIFIAVTILFFPYIVLDLFKSNKDTTTIYWLIFFVPIQFSITFVCVIITWFLKRKREK